ncbi:hypothetical protein BB559_002961 [Furculomyces boomerangus]|uniref:Transcription factor domain-containing protein n=1 Tax=Furculomyces boomerangus TaxID=61424 RepID=A0A2T9YQE6_9FUNG|nr:hypothetical protein BB559_002961 [Furculomyces boomerangus]
MTSNQFEYSNSFFADTIHGLPIPNRRELKKLSLILPHVFPETMIPMRLPEFINKLTNKKYPFYFIFAVLAAGVKYIKTTRNGKDKELETKYATKSIELMRKETDVSDPLIVWACIFILVYTSGTKDLKSNIQVKKVLEMAVKKTRLYQLDLNKNLTKIRYGYTKDELEFRRRVWWVYYFQITGNYIFNGNFITFEQRDIVYKGAAKLLLETEDHIINHLLRCIYYSMFIYLYQSELVRDQDIKIRPERVKAAKQQCIDASIKQMELMEWYSQNVPTEYQGFPHIVWSLNSLVSLTNFFFIQDPSLKEKHTNYFNRIVSVYKSFDKNSEVVDSLLMFVNAMTKIKTKASENNKKYIHLLEYMKPFGISEHDIEPWIIPKYGSFFHSHCCIIANFSTLDIGEYLGGIITTVSVFQNELYSEAYKDSLKKLNQHEKQEEKLPNGYLSQITRTILDLTKGLHIKKSIVVDKGFDIEYFYHKKPLVFDSSLLIVNRSFPENKSKIKRTLKSTSLGGSCEHSTKIFNNKNIPKKSRKNKMRLEYLLNKN